jgi:isoleucyl-tRNA synthetase
MDILLDALCKWLAPFTSFTAEEAWLARHPSADGSVHLETFPVIPAEWRNESLAADWQQIRNVRRVVTGALEVERVAKRIGSSLQAKPTLYVAGPLAALVRNHDMAEICITSGLMVLEGAAPEGAFTLADVEGVGVVSAPAEGEKCQRCWKVLNEVGGHKHDGVCGRCSDAVDALS